MKNLRKITMLLLMAVMVAAMLVVPGGNVQAAKKKKVQLNKKTVTLEVGKKVTLKLKNAPKKKKITWSSNKKKIASVNKKGVVTAKKAGKANITAKVKGKKYVCKVTVKKKAKKPTTTTEAPTNTTPTAPANVKVSKLEWSGGSDRTDMDISEKVTVSVAVSPENASNKNIEWSVESGSLNGEPGDVIELTPHGLSADITAIGKGYATITAKSTDGSNLEIKYDIFVHWAKIYITTSNVEYQSIVGSVNYDDDLIIVDRNLELRGDVPWEKLKSTLSFSVPAGYTMTYTDYEDPDWVYTKGYFQIKNSAGKTVDDFYLTYYVNDLTCGYKNDNSQVEFKDICDGADDSWEIYLEGDVPWSEVNKEQLHFTCDKEGFEAVPEWKTNALGSDVGYVYLKGIGEQTPCKKYEVFYNNRKTEIDRIQCKNGNDLKYYYVYGNFIVLHSCKAWDDIKDELEYYGDGKQFSFSYDEANPEDQGYVAVLNIKEGDSIVRKYNISYMQLPTISYNPQYKDLGVSAIDIIYGSSVYIDIYTSEQLDLQTVIKQLNFTCVDHPSYGFAELDGSDGGGGMYICDGDDYICNIYFRLIQE